MFCFCAPSSSPLPIILVILSLCLLLLFVCCGRQIPQHCIIVATSVCKCFFILFVETVSLPHRYIAMMTAGWPWRKCPRCDLPTANDPMADAQYQALCECHPYNEVRFMPPIGEDLQPAMDSAGKSDESPDEEASADDMPLPSLVLLDDLPLAALRKGPRGMKRPATHVGAVDAGPSRRRARVGGR